ncbi:recombinase family protein [Kitasatospora sp. NPDC001527]|uniref:recombinase family protein n=1 Tax=Kitasatospora sp. NPDC001527 TaxID=3154519 RepID=UPI00332D6A5E
MGLDTFIGTPGQRVTYEGMRAGIYARKSNYAGKKKSLHRSVAEQLEASHADAVRFGVTVGPGCEYVDDGISASRYGRGERDEFERLLDDIQNRRLDMVICWASTRLQRDLAVYVRLRDACAAAGVLLVYGGRVYDMASKDDRFRTGLDALVGEREVDELRDNVKRSLRANAANGRPHGPTAYGYRRVYDERTGAFIEVVPHEDEAPVVRFICTRYGDGDGPAKIKRALEAKKIPPPSDRWTAKQVERVALGPTGHHPMHGEIQAEATARLLRDEEAAADIAADFNNRGLPAVVAEWATWTIKKIATDPRYLGTRVSHGVATKENAWPALIDMATHARCLAITTKRASEREGSRPTAAVHWLSGIGRCHKCSFIFYTGRRRHRTIDPKTGEGKQVIQYKCKTPAAGEIKGFHFSLDVELVDRHVEGQLFDWLSEPRWFAAYLAADEKRSKKHAEKQGELAILRARLDAFYKSAAAGETSPAALAAVERELNPKIKELEGELTRLRVPSVVRDIAVGRREDVAKAWKQLDLEQRRLIASTLLDVRLKSPGQGVRPTAETIGRYVIVTPKGMKLAA